jgi:hypothetical protein
MRTTFDARRSVSGLRGVIPLVILLGMKTAISIPDDVFTDAEALARELKQSRSQLYSRAVREYVARHSSDSVTAALDALCASPSDDDFATAAGRRTLEQSEW